MSIFEQASYYTFNSNIKTILLNCAKNKFPQQFKLSRDKIVTMKGNKYDIPSDPMDLCNLIQKICMGNDIPDRKPIPPSSTTKRKTDDQLDIAIYAFCIRETYNLNKDLYYTNMLYSCIYTGLYTKNININDIIIKNGCIIRINGLNTKELKFIKK